MQIIMATYPKLPPYMVKTLKYSAPEPESRLPWDLVCCIKNIGPTKFIQIMILG